jgi:hypothetical protein
MICIQEGTAKKKYPELFMAGVLLRNFAEKAEKMAKLWAEKLIDEAETEIIALVGNNAKFRLIDLSVIHGKLKCTAKFENNYYIKIRPQKVKKACGMVHDRLSKTYMKENKVINYNDLLAAVK